MGGSGGNHALQKGARLANNPRATRKTAAPGISKAFVPAALPIARSATQRARRIQPAQARLRTG
jgi:hypothetical protein